MNSSSVIKNINQIELWLEGFKGQKLIFGVDVSINKNQMLIKRALAADMPYLTKVYAGCKVTAFKHLVGVYINSNNSMAYYYDFDNKIELYLIEGYNSYHIILVVSDEKISENNRITIEKTIIQ